MSDYDPLTIAALEAVQASVAVELTLDHEDLTPLQAILARAHEDAAMALRTLLTIDSKQADEIRRLQNVAHRYGSLVVWLREIMAEGKEANQHLKAVYRDRAEEFHSMIYGTAEDQPNGALD